MQRVISLPTTSLGEGVYVSGLEEVLGVNTSIALPVDDMGTPTTDVGQEGSLGGSEEDAGRFRPSNSVSPDLHQPVEDCPRDDDDSSSCSVDK